MFHIFHRSGTRIVVLVLSAIFSANIWGSNEDNVICGEDVFKNVTYLIDVNSITSVSEFFNQIPSTKFKLFVISRGSRFRLETYFDDKDLGLLKNNSELLISVDENLPTYRVGRERVLLRDNNLGSLDYFEVKRYKKKATPLDKHELFGRVKRKQRQILIEKLQDIVKSPVEEFDVKLQVQHQEVVRLYRHLGVAYGAITLDQFHISNFGIPNTFSLLKFEIYADQLNDLQGDERAYLIKSFCGANTEFRNKFSEIPPYSSFGYSIYHRLALELLPSRALFKKYPLSYEIGQILLLVIIGFLIIYLFVGRYAKRHNYRKTMTGGIDKKHDSK